MTTLPITKDIALDRRELVFKAVLSGGPGGQNVNKLATAAQLRFDAAHSPSLSAPVRRRLLALAGQLATKHGVIVIDARRHRSLARNRDDALERLSDLVRRAAQPPRPRRPTAPPRAARERRLYSKRLHALTKRRRGRPSTDD